MASTSASSDMCSSSSTPTSAFDTLSSSLLYGLPPLSSPLNPNAAPVFFPSAVSPASVGPALSVAPPLLPYASHQSSSVYYPNPTPPPLSVSGLDGSWRPVASPALYYPSQPMAGQRALTAEWESTSFEYSSGIGHGGGMSALRGVGGGLPSLPYSGYPAFERCSVGRQSSNSGSSRQMSAGRQRWDSGSRWRAPSRGAGRQRSHHTHPQPQQLQSNQHTQLAIAGSAHTSSMPHTSDQALSTHDVANASPALSGVGRMFDPPSTKLVDRGLPRPEAIETALDDRGDRKVTCRSVALSSVSPLTDNHSCFSIHCTVRSDLIVVVASRRHVYFAHCVCVAAGAEEGCAPLHSRRIPVLFALPAGHAMREHRIRPLPLRLHSRLLAAVCVCCHLPTACSAPWSIQEPSRQPNDTLSTTVLVPRAHTCD